MDTVPTPTDGVDPYADDPILLAWSVLGEYVARRDAMTPRQKDALSLLLADAVPEADAAELLR